MNNRVTQEQRHQRMLAAGIFESDLAELHGPIVIDLGGQIPEDSALAASIVVYSPGE